jgi:hypothetical protein
LLALLHIFSALLIDDVIVIPIAVIDTRNVSPKIKQRAAAGEESLNCQLGLAVPDKGITRRKGAGTCRRLLRTHHGKYVMVADPKVHVHFRGLGRYESEIGFTA